MTIEDLKVKATKNGHLLFTVPMMSLLIALFLVIQWRERVENRVTNLETFASEIKPIVTKLSEASTRSEVKLDFIFERMGGKFDREREKEKTQP